MTPQLYTYKVLSIGEVNGISHFHLHTVNHLQLKSPNYINIFNTIVVHSFHRNVKSNISRKLLQQKIPNTQNLDIARVLRKGCKYLFSCFPALALAFQHFTC